MARRTEEHEEFSSVVRAVLKGLDEAGRLVHRHRDRLHARNETGETPLHWLAVENRLDAVAFLAKRGAAVDTRNNFGQTPLMDAARLGHTKMVRLLLSLGADPKARDAAGESVLDHATLSSHRSPAVLRLLQEMSPESA